MNDLNRIHLLKKAKSLPKSCGCYLMKNQKNEVVYVGKSKELRTRVSSYFNESQKTPKTEILVSHIKSFDFILTENEVEALVLENNLIKKFTPRYNILMRDDKSYPYVYINLEEPFPRLRYDRRPNRNKNSKIFGPFTTGSNISEVIRVITKAFELRDCTLREFKQRKEPCLLYQMKQCSAPCVNKISEFDYNQNLELALSFFGDNSNKALTNIRNRMRKASDNEEYELAAMLRDMILILEDFLKLGGQENAEIHQLKETSVDIVSPYLGESEIDISIYMIRNSHLIGHKNFHFPLIDCLDEIHEEIVNFLIQYYLKTNDELPHKIIMEGENIIEFSEALNQLIQQNKVMKNNKIKVERPKQKFKSLFELTTTHAKEQQRVRLENQDSVYVGLNKLKDLLSMSVRPKKLECYDIAIWQGKSPTASQVVSIDGKLIKDQYRYYHISVRDEGNNDFAMMREVLQRRLKKGDLPDVFIVDGGKGQVSSFQSVLKEFDINIPVVGIAKSKTKSDFKEIEVNSSKERLIIPGRVNPYFLEKNKSLFKIIVQLRDEAHRFSRKLHHNAEESRLFTSWPGEIPGIGPKTVMKILKNLRFSREELAQLSFEELKKELGIKNHLVEKVYKYLHSTK
ncbi:MAG: excinuclease ABC subunit UvrC [Halobacteriovoraceae bacterium]|nr:excinuclease ABC subunit UvrC [Halobacteriovoraceae bacterium]